MGRFSVACIAIGLNLKLFISAKWPKIVNWKRTVPIAMFTAFACFIALAFAFREPAYCLNITATCIVIRQKYLAEMPAKWVIDDLLTNNNQHLFARPMPKWARVSVVENFFYFFYIEHHKKEEWYPNSSEENDGIVDLLNIAQFRPYFAGSTIIVSVHYACPALAYNQTACLVKQERLIKWSDGKPHHLWNVFMNPFNTYLYKTELSCF